MCFFEGECVWSKMWGIGRVVGGGEDPEVQFLMGGKQCVPGSTIKIIPEEEFEAAIANREQAEQFIDLLIYGRVMPRPTALPQRFDLHRTLQTKLPGALPDRVEQISDASLCFIADDLNGGVGT